jgi:hypothetical protein
MILRLSLIIAALMISSCTLVSPPIETPPPSASSTSTVVDTGMTLPPAPVTLIEIGSGEVRDITLDLTNGTGMLRIDKGARAKARVHFMSNTPSELTVHLTTPGDQMANIRVTQIILPDGQSDGPFGRDMTFGR